MSNVDYKGSVTLISGLTQANNSSFPLVDGDAVQYKQEINEDGTFKSVSQKLSEFNRSYEYATSDDIDGILNGLFGQYKRLSLTGDTMLENTFEDQLKILSVNGNSYQPTSNNIVPTPEKPIPIISKKTNIKRISPNVFDFEKENDTSNIPDSGTYRSIRSYQLKPDTQYIFSWSSATVPAKGTLSFQIQNNTGTVLVSPFTYFNISSDEKEETGKDVEFTTDSSGIIKFAYNCIVGTSSSLETYQQYWYTKILRDIALKESVLESEQIELRSLKETINKFDLGLLSQVDLIPDNRESYRKINIPITLKPNTRYKIYHENSMLPALSWMVLNIVDNAEKNLVEILNVKNTENDEVEKQAINLAFTSPNDGEIYFSYYVQSYNTEGVLVPQTTETFKEKWFTKILKNIMVTEESLNQNTYVSPTIRDYKIVDHTTQTSKIVRNINQFELPTDFSWNDTDYYPNIIGNVIPEDKKGVYDTRDYSLINYTIKQYFNYSNVSGMYLGFSECDTYWELNNSDEVNAFLTRIKEDGKPFIFQYQLATPVEEPITYVETDVSEVGYSWQDTTSPSPTIKSEVKPVEKIDILKTGKNLFDINDEDVYLSPNITHNGNQIIKNDGSIFPRIKLKNLVIDKEYTLSYSTKLNKSISSGQLLSAISSKNMGYPDGVILYKVGDGGTDYNVEIKFTATQSEMYLIFSIQPETITNLQIELGDTATPYEPYQEQHVNITPPQPLYSTVDGSVADEVDVEKGVYRYWLLRDKIGNVISSVMLGSLNGDMQKYFTDTLQDESRVPLSLNDQYDTRNLLCTNYNANIESYMNASNETFSLYMDTTAKFVGCVNIERLNENTTSDIYNFIKDFEIVYPLLTPIEIPIPQEDLKLLKSLKTEQGVTNIFVGGEVKPSLNIEYKGT